MKVDTILNTKGREVETTRPDTGVVMAVHKLATMGIGALVVSEDGARVEGVISERDVVRGLAKHGPRLLDMRVGEVMTRHAPTCSPDDSIKDVMARMTRTRQRHLPVVRDGNLYGLISLGDVVKNRLEELELEANVLRDSYITHQ